MINILSLFDGISCGQLALKKSNIKYDKYYASEIDKFAIKVLKVKRNILKRNRGRNEVSSF